MVNLIVAVWMVLAAISFFIYLLKPGNEYVLGTVLCLVTGGAFLFIKEKLRRRRDGFYIETKGNADGGDMIYHEAENALTFYFDRRERMIYIPSDQKWDDHMPDWARTRRAEILENIRQKRGSTWRFGQKPE